MGERLEIDEIYCTVRYIGLLPTWPDNIAYGVEWDKEGRGKHDGSIGGVRYFRTNKKCAGSFLKDSKIAKCCIKRRSFDEAILMKYGDSTTTNITLQFGTKKTQSYGFQHLNEINGNFRNLVSISLPRCNIYKAFSTSDQFKVFSENTHNVLTTLDLSFNLLSDVEEVYKILENFPSLKTAVLSGNILSNFTCITSRVYEFPNITKLSLACCNLKNEDLPVIMRVFPNIQTIDLSSNEISTVPPLVKTIIDINLSTNQFTSIPNNLMHSSSVRVVDLSNNEISQFPNVNENTSFSSLRVDANEITDWKEVDKVSSVFPNLKTLWIRKNPFCADDTQDNFYSIIARTTSIRCLDGTDISEDLRKEAELYFISSVLSSKMPYNRTLLRWRNLLEKYSITSEKRAQEEEMTNFLQSELITLKVVYHEDILTLRVLKGYSVRYLRTILRQKLKNPDIKLQYSVIEGLKHEFSHEFSSLASFNIEESVIYAIDGD